MKICAHRLLCKTINHLRVAWGDLLSSTDIQYRVRGLELYFRLYDVLQNLGHPIAAAETPKSLIQRHGFDLTQGEVRALGGVPGICIEADQPDSELIHVDGRVAINLLADYRLRPSVLGRFLVGHDFPALSRVFISDCENSGVQDFVANFDLMNFITLTNIKSQSVDWGPGDLDEVDYGSFNVDPVYKTIVQSWAVGAEEGC